MVTVCISTEIEMVKVGNVFKSVHHCSISITQLSASDGGEVQ